MVLKVNYRTILNEIINKHIEIGIEVEKHRVNQKQSLSLKPFPEDLSASLSPYVKREFCTAQLEFTMPYCADSDQNVDLIRTIIRRADQQLNPEEHLWPYSCPPKLSCQPDEVPISQYPKESTEYRRQSCQRYDVRRLLNNGVHINLSFSKEAMTYLIKQLNFKDTDELYLQIAQHFMYNRWLLTYLFGATPFAGRDYFDNNPLDRPVRSIRSSSLGFANDVRGDYRSVQHYIGAIDRAVEHGELLQPREYYESVRLKSGNSKDPHRILEHGITHLELRTFDLNPLIISAVTEDQLRLIQIMTLYFVYQPRWSGTEVMKNLAAATKMNEQVALETLDQQCSYTTRGLALLTDILSFINEHQLGKVYVEVINKFSECFKKPTTSLAYRVYENFAAY
ncbi:hypothetical protein [Lapidilactobacillus dextrinicus]|nr:hypothetical protein [Lapidilactobacillus dextrinicus]